MSELSPNATHCERPSAIYVWLVPSEEVLEQPGGWRIRKWDTAPFPEANFALSATASAELDEDGERYRWFRDECDEARRIEILEASEGIADLIDHHIDKGRCGL